ILDFDVLARLPFQLEVARWRARDIGYPRLQLGTFEIRLPLRIGPAQAHGPVPVPAHGGIEKPVQRRAGNLHLDEGEAGRRLSRWYELRRVGHLKMMRDDRLSHALLSLIWRCDRSDWRLCTAL